MRNFGMKQHGDGAGQERRQARGDFWGWGGRGGMHGGHGMHGGPFGGRVGRLFEHGDLRFVILHLIAEKPRHGYEIIKAIEEKVGGTYSPSPGTIYPALTMLEEQGHIAVEQSEGAKKLYAITDEGRAYLELNGAAVRALIQRMEHIGARLGDGPAPQIVRAAENLRMALHLKLHQGAMAEEQVRAITEALDRAAREIEGA